MQVILLQDDPNLGNIGDVIRCKRGFVRNYLLPNKIVVPYSKEVKEQFEKNKKNLIKQQKAARKELEDIHAKLDGFKIKESYHAQDDGSLYGAVTQSAIVDLLQKQNITIKRNQVFFANKEPIKDLGEHKVQIQIAKDLMATINFKVTASKK